MFNLALFVVAAMFSVRYTHFFLQQEHGTGTCKAIVVMWQAEAVEGTGRLLFLDFLLLCTVKPVAVKECFPEIL